MADFDPYHEWLGIPPNEQPPHAYRLLGLTLHESNPKSIEAAAEQRTLLLKSRASGPHSDVTQKLLNEVQRARLLLLDDAKRTNYDADLRQKLKHSAPASTAKPLPRAQALPEPVAEKPTGPAVMVTDAARRAHPAAPPASSMPWIVAAAVGGALLLGGMIYLATRTPEKPPVAQKPPEARPMPPTPRPPVQPPKQGSNPSPFVPAPMKEPMPDPGVKPPDVKPDPVVPPEIPDPPVAPMPPPTDPPEPVPAEPPKDERRPKPLPAEQEKALQSFREIFKDDLAKAKKPDQWQALSTRLLEVAAESKDDPATQFVLLDQARQLSAAAGLWETSEQAIAALAEIYQVDGTALRIESMEKAFEGPIDAAGRKKLAATGLALFDTLLAKQELDQAVQLSKVLAEPVKATRDKDLTAGLAARKKRGGEMFQARTRVTAARAALKAKPDDPEANLELGKSLLILGRPWEEILPHLAAGSDPGWKAAAAKELAHPQELEPQIAAGDAWWDLSERAEADVKTLLQRRAASWYRTLLPQVTGITKAKLERRLASLPKEDLESLADPIIAAAPTSPESGPRPAAKLIKEIYLDELREDYARVFFGHLGGFGWEDDLRNHAIRLRGEQPPHSVFMHPAGTNASRAVSIAQYDIGGAFSTFSAIVGYNENNGFPANSATVLSVFGDGKPLWQSKPIRNQGETEEFSISVRGVHQLRLETRADGNPAQNHAIWGQPKLSGGTKPLALLADRLTGRRPVYLDDLIPVDALVGHNVLALFGSSGYYPAMTTPYFTINERRVFHALGMHARGESPAFARYRLEGRARSLRVTAAMQAVPEGVSLFGGALTFRIHGDGRELWESKPMRKAGESEPCTVNLTGVNDLELSIECVGNPAHGWAAWLEPQLELAKKSPPPAPDAAITADEIVIYNTHNGNSHDFGSHLANVLLYLGDQLVAEQTAVHLLHDFVQEPATRIPIPRKPFNRLRVEILGVNAQGGGGLNEIEVLRQGKNLAPQAIATASDNYAAAEADGLFAPSMVVDGIRGSTQARPGFWLLPYQTNGWIELEWRGAEKNAKPHPVLGYPLAKHPHTAIPFGGHWYLPFPGRITWDEAQQRCQAMGGYMACVETDAEGQFLETMARRQNIWLGGKRSPAGQWRWINGHDLVVTRWLPGEPTNSEGREDRLAIILGRGWNDTPNIDGGNRGYICEWEQ